jgi:glycosyltransferase involved in cell wall biosynthesis
MNILWCSNWAAQSSYAIQSRLIVPRLQKLGHQVTVFELSSGPRLPYQVNGITVLSPSHDALGNDIIVDHAMRSKADAVITLMDVWRFQPDVWRKVPFYPHAPIDHTPVTPGVRASLSAARRVIAMSLFGMTELKKIGAQPLYVPLAYDPAIWHPRDKQAAREALHIPPDAFWVSFVGVNDSIPSRKGIPELLSAWQSFSSRYPSATLYMHTALHGNLPINGIGGVKIDALMATLALDPARVKIVDQYEYRTGIKHEQLATMIAASDVVILPSRGEGFGLPLIEAQASGIPVITTRTAAGTELVKAGWLIDGESEWSYQDAFWMRPGILSITECLEAAYQQRDNPALRQLAIEGVREYAVDNVVQKYWKPVLTQLAEASLEALQVTA